MIDSRRCRQCGRTRPLSNRRLCNQCAEANMLNNMHQQKSKSGPLYDKAKKRYDEIMPQVFAYYHSSDSTYSQGETS